LAVRDTPPFRADHVGSLLRPSELLQARGRFKAGEIDADTLRAIEDDAIRDVIQLQHDAGVRTVTDGEFRRGSWHMDFIYSLGGIRQVDGESIHVRFRNEEGELDYAPPAMLVAEKITLTRTVFAEAFAFLRDNALGDQTPKLTIPSPSMVHYRGGTSAIDRDVYPELGAFWDDLIAAHVAELRTAHTGHLDRATLAAARELLDDVFGDEMTDEAWEHALGGIHALAWDRGELIGHASVVQRRLLHLGRALRTGYVEGVAVRADRRGEGHGAALMEPLEAVIRGGYEVGALGAADAAADFYAVRGWKQWRGTTSALTPAGIVRTEDEDASIYVLPISAPLDLRGELTCDWRDGEVW